MTDTSKEIETLGLEENFAKIEELIEKMSKDTLSLEDAFTAYKEGMDLLKLCNEQIDRVEKKVLVLNENGALEEL